MASQIYYEHEGAGDMYYALDDTLPGQNPTTAPLSWERILIPARARSFLRLAAAAHVRRGENDVAAFGVLHGLAKAELRETTRVAARETVPFMMPVLSR